jgi:hypothetical protein
LRFLNPRNNPTWSDLGFLKCLVDASLAGAQCNAARQKKGNAVKPKRWALNA